MRDNPRTTLISALAGLVLLGGVVAFTVVVPDLGDDPATETQAAEGAGTAADLGPIDLPDELPGGLVAVDLGTLPATLTGEGFDLERLRTQQVDIGKGLVDTFGVPGAFRTYAAPDGQSVAQVVVLDKAPGLFAPEALPIDPATLGLARDARELVKVDDAVCSVFWGEDSAVPAGQPVDTTKLPQSVRCELGAGERTYDLSSQGLTVAATVDLLNGLASA